MNTIFYKRGERSLGIGNNVESIMYDCVSQPTQKHVLVNVEMNRYCELEERLALSRYQLSSCVRRILEDGIIQAERARREVYGAKR